jgi:hypothetical protein
MEPIADPIQAIVPNLVTCMNNRINTDKFENLELLRALELFLGYAAAMPQQPMNEMFLPNAIQAASQAFNVPISREGSYEIAKNVADMILAVHRREKGV